jgi:hypothetical protein
MNVIYLISVHYFALQCEVIVISYNSEAHIVWIYNCSSIYGKFDIVFLVTIHSNIFLYKSNRNLLVGLSV